MTEKNFPHRFILIGTLLLAFIIYLPSSANADLEDYITKTETGFYYTVQQGDTLWDLSEEFDNSPWQWPEMWHYNPDISNPHLIYPGQKILIFKKEWEGLEKPKKDVEVKKEMPLVKVETFYTVPQIDKLGFIRKEPVPACGKIFKSDDYWTMLGERDRVFISKCPDGPILEVGKKYTIFRTIGPIHDDATNELIGFQHVVIGAVDITKIEPDFAVGYIKNVYREVLVDDMLMPYHEKSNKILVTESRNGLIGKILKPENDDKTIIEQNVVAFIDKGKNDGVTPGQYYTIYTQDGNLTPRDIGELLVLLTEDATSTVMITKSIRAIESGNAFRTVTP